MEDARTTLRAAIEDILFQTGKHDQDECSELADAIIRDVPGKPGAVWVKATARLPGIHILVKWRIGGKEWGLKEATLGMWYNKPNDFHKYEWYDEGTAAVTREDDGLALLAWLNKNEWGSAGNGEYINHNTGRIIKEEKLYQEFKQRKEK